MFLGQLYGGHHAGVNRYERRGSENLSPAYHGRTVGLRATTISYKNKQRIERPESERFAVENSREALITQERRDIVQEDLHRVTYFARMKEKQLAAYISSKNTLELRRKMNTVQKELDAMRAAAPADSAMEQGEVQPHIARPLNEVFQLPA